MNVSKKVVFVSRHERYWSPIPGICKALRVLHTWPKYVFYISPNTTIKMKKREAPNLRVLSRA